MTIMRPRSRDTKGGRPAVDPVLDKILVCPVCKGKLEARDSRVSSGDEDRTRSRWAELACARCRLAFVVDGGIPIMMMGRARCL